MKKQAQKINQSELINLLNKVENGQFINLFIITKVKMKKKGNPYLDQIFKVNCFNLMIGNSYETRVRTETEKAGLPMPEIGKNNVGQHISKIVLFNEEKNCYYLQFELPKNYKSKALHFFQNTLITKDKFKEFLPAKKFDPNKPVFLTVKLENIKTISINKIKYIVE